MNECMNEVVCMYVYSVNIISITFVIYSLFSSIWILGYRSSSKHISLVQWITEELVHYFFDFKDNNPLFFGPLVYLLSRRGPPAVPPLASRADVPGSGAIPSFISAPCGSRPARASHLTAGGHRRRRWPLDGGGRGGHRAAATWLARTLSGPAQSRTRARGSAHDTAAHFILLLV